MKQNIFDQDFMTGTAAPSVNAGQMKEHAQYVFFKDIMQRAYDCYYGEDVIKSGTTKYLPMLTGMKCSGDGMTLYDTYKTYATFFPATGRTTDAYTGMIFKRKPITGGDEKLLEYVSYDGRDADQVASDCCIDVILNHRCAVLVDYPSVETEGMTQAEVERMNIRPYMIFYPQHKIITWKETQKNGLAELESVTLYEIVNTENIVIPPDVTVRDDGTIEGRRVLRLERAENGTDFYVNELYAVIEKNNTKEYILISRRIPLMNGSPLAYIPITPCSTAGKWDIDYPMINDLVLLNLADYRNDALYRNALIFVGRPTICMSGYIPDDITDKAVAIGSSSVMQFSQGGSSWLLGGDASAVAAVREESERLKKQMAAIGARSLMADSSVQEAAETASIRRAGETGILSLIARAINRTMTVSFKIMAEWAGLNPDDYFYRLSTDYASTKADMQQLQTIFTMYLQGEIPLSVFYNVLDKAEVLPDDMTEEKFSEEMEAVKAEKAEKEVVTLTDDGSDEEEEDDIQAST